MERKTVIFHPRRPTASAKATERLSLDTPTGDSLDLLCAFKVRQLPDESLLAVSASGDHAFVTEAELRAINGSPEDIPLSRRAELAARFFLPQLASNVGSRRLLAARRAAKRETVENGPALHILVLTLQCAHSCQYCQVSRSLEDQGHTMTFDLIDAACDGIFESTAASLTVEFQGGDPLLRFDLVAYAIHRIDARNKMEGRRLRFVVASTLHQLTPEMCEFFKEFGVYLSTSIDGPAELHNKNRPTRSRDAYERTIGGIELARQRMGPDSVSALMTTTRASLSYANAIVDEYVRLGFSEIFLRPLSSYGFAKRNQARLGYSVEEFAQFYNKALDRVFYWNSQGIHIREVYASIVLNKILSTFDGGYVDLQSPTAVGSAVLVYNYDGYVYPSDEARMLAETGDVSLRLGRIGTPLKEILASPVRSMLVQASKVEEVPGCDNCAYNQFCAPNPVDAQAQFGTPFVPVMETEHCERHMWLFDSMFMKLRNGSDGVLDLLHNWAQPSGAST